ncbi:MULTISPECIES: caspase family protein [Stenotrophomonas maltophilia group]|uniref:caspase family protein n=1 Tax=Stenotrophomonas maltophilia TaxID=40324 RepID=UPI0011B91159|nr:caspase family protein [Stenotrophomonas maltophilia]GFF08539.1 hypothetical protein SM139_3595 [Stenotrophomonas maltophilia]
MPRDDHYAIVLTINRYPGLSDLHGPENDGDEFRQWLLDPKYGDLAAQHIQVIRSQDYGVAATPDDANPTETELKKALNRWLRTQTGWQDRIGQRLYLFFAGHGFTAGSMIHDPALFSAVAQNGDTAHIAVLRYASKIASAGFFDEIILVTDCCQDVLKASQVLEPTWTPPDRQRTADVRLFQAYGAPRGRQSFERNIGQNGQYRGLFTSVLLEALRTASPDADGWVTDRSVADHFQVLWADRYEQETGYTPPLIPASQKRIRLYRQSASAAALTSSHRVAVDLSRVISKSAYIDRRPAPDSAPSQPTAPMSMVEGRWLRSSDLLRFESPIVDLAPGLHLVLTPGDQPDIAFEVPYPKSPSAGGPCPIAIPTLMPALPAEEVAPQQVMLRTANPNAEITVLDASYARVGIGTGTVSLLLPKGLYKTLVRIGPASMQSLLIVTDAPLDELLPEPQFSSAAPVAGTSNAHEYHADLAARYSVVPVEQVGDLGESGEVFVFARDSSLNPNRATDAELPWQRWSLSSLVGSIWERRFVQKGADDLHGYGYVKTAVTPGSLALRTTSPSSEATEDGLVVPVIPGWRTEVYLDCAAAPSTLPGADGDGRLALDLATASIHLVRTGSASLLFDPIGLATEAARMQLAAGRNVAVPSPEQAMASPMWALYAAQAAYQQGAQQIDMVRKCVLAVPEELREGLCDFAVLAQWLGLPTAGHTIHDPPMLATSWQLAAKLEARSGLASELFEEVGQWQTGGSLWALWRRSIDSRGVLRRRLMAKAKTDQRDLAEKHTNSVTQPKLNPTWSLDTWVPVEEGLKHPNPDHSPFQQALRRRLLDALTEIRHTDSATDESITVSLPPESDVFALAKQFMLSSSYAAAAYNTLYVDALRQAGPDPLIEWVSVVVDEPTLDSTATKSKHTRHLSLDDH